MVKAFQKKKDSVIEEGKRKKQEKETIKAMKEMKSDEAYSLAGGGLAEATAKLKAKGMSEGGSVVSMDTSPNSGLITTKGFGAGRKT